MENEKHSKEVSRRKFLRNSGYVAGGLIGGGVIGGLVTNAFQSQDVEVEKEKADNSNSYNEALMYFTNMKDFEVVKAFSERIFPKDENGPGAIELNVPFYIDHQLAGPYGNNAREYMQGPFYPGSTTQGYQSRLKKHQAFDEGIKAINNYSQQTFKKDFTELSPEEQDQVVTAFETGKVKMKGILSETFFGLFRGIVIEGVYADPLYGGNKDMQGWKMKEYPGDKMSYIQVIDQKEFFKEKPTSLKDHMNH